MSARTLEITYAWDRLHTETPTAYSYFIMYRDMGAARSLRGLSSRDGTPNLRQLQHFSTKNDWVERCRAWDSHVERELALVQIDAHRDMRRRQAEMGIQLQNAALDRIRSIVIDKLTVRECLLVADLGVKLERQARGDEPTVAAETADQIDGPTGADILAAIREHPQLLELVAELDRVMYADEDTTAE